MKRFLILISIFALTLTMCPCAYASDNFDADITIVQALDMRTFDPIATSDMATQYILYHLYSRLFGMASDRLAGIPELCKEYKLVSDTEWHFTIWDNVKFHDGSPLTADDVVYSLNRAKNGTTIGALFKPVLEITKVDDRTISITTDGPYPGLCDALTHNATCIIPKNYGEKASVSNDWSNPVGSGRYKFESRVIGDTVKFSRFDDYFNPEEKARNKSITFKIIPEGTNRTIAIESGTADLNVEFVPTDYDRVVNNPKLKLWEHHSAMVYHLGMDTTHEWFKNKLVRQAIGYAIDREACLTVGHNGKGEVLYNSATFANAPAVLGAIQNPLDMYRYDPEKAQALMDEAKCPGFDTKIVVFRDEAERIATLIQGYLAVINIRAEVVRVENPSFPSVVASHGAPLFVAFWGCYWDPDLYLARRFSKSGIGGVNRVFYGNEELDRLIVEGRSSFDPEKRAEVYKRVQEFLAVEAPEHDLYIHMIYALSNDRLKGVDITVERPHNYWKLHY